MARGAGGAQDYNRMTFFPVQAIQQENIIFPKRKYSTSLVLQHGMIKQPWTPNSAFFSMYWLLSLSVGAVRARFAENSCKVFPELCRFPARRRLRGEPGAEGESMSMSMRLSVRLSMSMSIEYESNIF